MSDKARSRSPEENRLLELAARRLPGGALGSARFPDELAFVVKRGRGSKVWDMSGREYIDYLLGSGPMILGHSHPAVVAAVRDQLENGTTYFMVNEPIIMLADELCRAVPCAEQVRFTSTGTEATFFALRAARAVRGRDKVMKFEGGYHGGHDYALMSAAPRSPKAFPAATADSAGIPHVLEGEVLIAPYNDLATGFRFAYGGAQEQYGVVPDLAAYGKIIGGGFPLAAVCGQRAIMRAFDPRLEGTPDFVAQVGTLNGNPIAAVAGLATLAELRKPGAYARLHRTGRALRDGLAEIVRKSGLAAQVIGETTVFDVVFTDRPITDYRATLTADGARLRAFNAECLRRGVVKGVSKIYVTLAHGDDDVARTLAVFAEAIDVVSGSAPPARA